jgi:hypothetical protein
MLAAAGLCFVRARRRTRLRANRRFSAQVGGWLV